MRDYREILINELEQRQLNNENYSLRAFARDLGVAPSRLSEILRGKQGLSRERARQVSKKLGYDETGQQYFFFFFDLQHARSAMERERAKKQLENQANLNSIQQIKSELKFLNHWYDLALRRLTQVKGFESDPQWIAHRLGISVLAAEQAIEQLVANGLLKKDESGHLSICENIATGSKNVHPEYSEEIKNLYTGFFERAIEARLDHPIDYRDHSAHVFAINYDQVQKIKAFLRKLEDEIDAETYLSEEKDAVYCLATQFFCIEKNPPQFGKATTGKKPS